MEVSNGFPSTRLCLVEMAEKFFFSNRQIRSLKDKIEVTRQICELKNLSENVVLLLYLRIRHCMIKYLVFLFN